MLALWEVDAVWMENSSLLADCGDDTIITPHVAPQAKKIFGFFQQKLVYGALQNMRCSTP